MQMTDEQVWTDLERFAAAMKRGATVVMKSMFKVTNTPLPDGVDYEFIKQNHGIREIIEPPQKKVRPLNAEEWRDVAGCVLCPLPTIRKICVIAYGHNHEDAQHFADHKASCHPPGFPADVRKLWVEE